MKIQQVPIVLALLCGSALPAVQAAPKATPMSRPTAVSASTRALFRFQRDDAALGGVTRIRVNAAHVAARPVSQNVFGNFVENLGTVIYDILWADALHNGNLERIEDANREAPYWDQTGAASWQEAPGSGYLSPRCVRLAGPNATLSQRVFLPATRVRGYRLTFWTRAAGAAGRLTVAVRTGEPPDGPFHAGDEAAGRAVVQTPVSVTGTEWHKETLRWTLPARAIAKGEAARLVIAHAGGGAVDVDQFTLFPDDAVDGFDPDALRAAQAWHIPLLRFSGNYSSGYHWRDGVGPREARPTVRNVAWGGVDSHAFGTDEFLDLARRLGAVPQIGVNAGDGTPEEAAAWVRYCNAKSERVPLWEIGNELYGGWQIGHTDPAGNAARFVAFRAAMKAADPKIHVLATGKGDAFGPDGLAEDKAWNDAVLQAAVAHGGAPPAYLTIHPLVALPGGLEGLPYAERYESAMAHPAFMDDTQLPQLVAQIKAAAGPDAPTRIAPTEWGIIIGGDRWQEGPNHNVTAGAVYNALALNTFLRHGDWVTLANMTALLHGGCIKKHRGVVYVDPQYYTSQLYAAARPETPVETVWTGPGRDVPRRGFLPAAQNVPDIDVFSALNAKGELAVFAVNRHQTQPRPVHLDIAGFPVQSASATLLTSDDPQAGNTWDHPDTVRPRPFPLPKTTGAGAGLEVSLPPHALVVFTFGRK